ncbi:MAG: hypothetical protein JW807_06300 [Spirochaetes bacterium]|nr:hypothetical protein [Spirochaetota bacterium]
MADKIIQTLKTASRRPGVSFVLSLFFTGLGQMYNGDLAKGAVFALFRIVVFLALPASVAARGASSSIDIFLAMAAASLAVAAAAPVDALARARRGRELPVRAYNAAPYYVIFAVAQKLSALFAAAVLAGFYSILGVHDNAAGPLLERGDIVLVRKYLPDGPVRGELVEIGGGNAARVIARAGETVWYAKNIFYVNGRFLPMGYLADDIINRFTKDREHVLSETGGTRVYPIRFKQSPDIIPGAIPSPVPKGSIIVASDTRLDKDFVRVVPAASVRGRVEGILFSRNIRKIGMDSFGDLR